MHDHSDHALLHAFATRGDEQAFAEVVRRWGSLVYGAALRRTGDHSMAEEAAQNVLTTLARRAAEIAAHPALAAWLQKAASYEAARALEKESNRRRVMHQYAQDMSADATAAEPAWQDALPLLDAAVASLPERDRQILLQRYWQAQPFRKIADAAGSSVAACEKRAERALLRLSQVLRRRGVALSITALAAGLTPALTKAAAPPAVLARLGAQAVAASKTSAGFLTTLLLMKSKLTPAVLLALLIALSGTGGYVAARSSQRAAAETSADSAASTIAGKRSAAMPALTPAAKAHRDSLHALLTAAQRDLITANMDPEAAARAAARIAAIAPEDIRAALALADELLAASADSSPLAALILQRWAEFDPVAACDTAHSRRAGRFLGMPALADPLKVWAARDPQAAFTWYQAKASASEASAGTGQRWKPISSLRWIMGAWALRDAKAAAAAFQSLTSKEEISGAITGFSEMSGTAPDRLAILDAIIGKAGEPRNAMTDMNDIFRRWSAHQPSGLAAWLDRSSVEKSQHDSAAKPILTGWLREDANAAVDWWFKAPGGYPERSHRMETLISAWSEADIFAASEWLAAQPIDATAARSMATLATQVSRSDPERGWEWALRIPDEFNRADTLRQVAATWSSQDSAAATAAVNASPLDETKRAEILKAISKP